MSTLRQALLDYLRVRRALGFKLKRDEKLLSQFLAYLEGLGVTHVTTETALAWATLPDNAHPSWLSNRLSIVRGFATHLHALDPRNEVPPSDLLPWRRCRATPWLYSEEDLAALLRAADGLRTAHRVATYQTLIGLLAVTGMRAGEVIRLDRGDFDADSGEIVVRDSKFGKSRALPLHRTAVDAVVSYLRRGDRPCSEPRSSALLVSTLGTRLTYRSVQGTFHRLVRRVGLEARSPSCRPRLHDLRHSFAVHTVLDGYRQGDETEARLALLSTYLGHVDPSKTYWYLSASPELLELAGARLEGSRGAGL